MKAAQRVLVVFIEPTPYILGFLRELEDHWSSQIDVIFLKKDHTQVWELV